MRDLPRDELFFLQFGTKAKWRKINQQSIPGKGARLRVELRRKTDHVIEFLVVVVAKRAI